MHVANSASRSRPRELRYTRRSEKGLTRSKRVKSSKENRQNAFIIRFNYSINNPTATAAPPSTLPSAVATGTPAFVVEVPVAELAEPVPEPDPEPVPVEVDAEVEEASLAGGSVLVAIAFADAADTWSE